MAQRLARGAELFAAWEAIVTAEAWHPRCNDPRPDEWAGGLRSLPLPAGAKTGSAEDPAAPGTGVDAWYTAALPMDDPEVVVTVFVHGGGEGNLTAEPAAKRILDYYLAHRADVRFPFGLRRPARAVLAPLTALGRHRD